MKDILHNKPFSSQFKGEFYTDNLHRMIYATDASVYREIPEAIAYPKDKNDLKLLVKYALEHNTSLIPRTAGTSLAGQCVGAGIVVDLSRHFTRILNFDPDRETIRVQPGVIRDELNEEIADSGLFFGPNTSTSNRCMIGGMTANNSSGSTSIKYGVTRDKVLEVEMILSDGKEVTFGPLTATALEAKLNQDDREGEIYRFFMRELAGTEVRARIAEGYPKADIHRRNTGYAIDLLCLMQPFEEGGAPFNIAKLISGSEGTLGLITAITLKLDKQPPRERVMVAAHFNSVGDTCQAVKPLMEHPLYACEMMDNVILDCTKNNKSQAANRFFIKGAPKAILLLEICSETPEDLKARKDAILETLERDTGAYACPVLEGDEINRAFELRKAGLGLLGNIVGDHKAVACIEDTAVSIDDLSAYIREFEALMEAHGQEAVYYAHAGAGELHLRPILNLKKSAGVEQFRAITTEVAALVKKYGGAMSGEHGEGRVRSEFIAMFIGEANYLILEGVKRVFDPMGIFNPGKIVDPVAMDKSLRYEADREEPVIHSFMDFKDSQGLLKAVEKCNGSGDCRKTERSGGAMCPSYHATRDEKHTTRARANALREVLTNPSGGNNLASEDLKEVLDLCLSCKACSSECPSNIDMAAYKAEFLHQYQQVNGRTLRDRLFAYSGSLNRLGAKFPALVNHKLISLMITRFGGIAPQRRLPQIRRCNLEAYLEQERNGRDGGAKMILYIDEFSQYLDTDIAKDAITLFVRLGYAPVLLFGDSARTFISKGFLPEARKCVDKLLGKIEAMKTPDIPVVGIEPSAILGFRDDFLRIASDSQRATSIAGRSFTIEEFIAGEFHRGSITQEAFTSESRTVKYHAHCHQKALSDIRSTFDMLNIPENYKVSMINSGCCGMAGSFGYEKEHYEVSMKIGEQRLFPAVRKAHPDVVITANGNSCRHQIYDGTGRIAMHPVSVLRSALKEL